MTKIAWADRVWNPVIGCSPVSPGCQHCYAARFAHRGLTEAHRGLTRGGKWTGDVRIMPDRLDEPRKWKKPQRIFVCSMSDLMHAGISYDHLHDVLGTIEDCPRHTFLVLTKRSEYLHRLKWPRNVWLGVTVEAVAWRYRIDHLRKADAAVRFVSFEPLLGDVGDLNLDDIHWAIVGGESGPGARWCDLRWIRSVIEQCRAAGVAVFVKQLGPRPSLHSRNGSDVAEWPEDLKIREFPGGNHG